MERTASKIDLIVPSMNERVGQRLSTELSQLSERGGAVVTKNGRFQTHLAANGFRRRGELQKASLCVEHRAFVAGRQVAIAIPYHWQRSAAVCRHVNPPVV